MLPGLVIGIALLSFFVSVGLQLSLRTVMLSHIVMTQPYVILVVYARMANFETIRWWIARGIWGRRRGRHFGP